VQGAIKNVKQEEDSSLRKEAWVKWFLSIIRNKFLKVTNVGKNRKRLAGIAERI